jgi:hypothetical protein
MSNWAGGILDWAERAAAAWARGDMRAFRALAAELDGVWTEAALDAHGRVLFGELGEALAGAVEAAEARALAQIDLGFGPADTGALDFVRGRAAVAAALDSEGWLGVPQALRERAFFSARVADLQTLTEMRRLVARGLAWDPAGKDGPVMDAGRFEKEMRRILIDGDIRTAGPEDMGTLKDIRSTPRLRLVFRVQTEQARGWAATKAGMDPAMLDAVPGYFFTRVEPRKNQRGEAWWAARWAAACAAAGGRGCVVSPMMGLKTSRVWWALGAAGPFGNPYEPFDWGSGMGREDADRDACEAAGLLRPGQTVEPVRVPGLNETLEAGVGGLDAAALDRLRAAFGGQIEVDGDRARWRGDAAADGGGGK